MNPLPSKPHPLDVALIMEVERARYRQKEFSDSHWANLLLATYRSICPSGHTPLVAAIEDILRMFCQSAKAAKERAAEYEAKGAPLPSWINLPTSDKWVDTCKKIQTNGIKFGPNGEFLCLLGDGD